MHLVRVHYLSRSIKDADTLARRIAEKVVEVHGSTISGHILVFVPGKQDIHQIVEEIKVLRPFHLIALPLYGGMDPTEQQKVFDEYPEHRKVIVATNIAETSVTIDGISAVIDSGLIKESDINSENGIGELDIIEHSQAGCDQRKGRAGRTHSGECYRMYTAANFRKRNRFTRPEIQRVSPLKTLLTMASVGIVSAETFPFIDKPDEKVVARALETLTIWGALDRKRSLTPLGFQMATLPMDPIAAKLVLEGRKFGCLKEMLTIGAFLSMPHALMRPKGYEANADEAHREFVHSQSDLLTYLNVWRAYRSHDGDKEWCRTHFANSRTLWEIAQFREQLKAHFRLAGVELSSTSDESTLMKCAVSALRYNLFEYCSKEGYCALFENIRNAFVYPASALARARVPFMVPTHIVETKRAYARNCTVARVEWLAEFLPELFVGRDTVLRSYEMGKDHALGEQVIVFRDAAIGTRMVTLSLEAARTLQMSLETRLQKEKLVRIVFRRCGASLVGDFNGGVVALNPRNKLAVEPGGTYYCTLNPCGGALAAEARYRVFDF